MDKTLSSVLLNLKYSGLKSNCQEIAVRCPYCGDSNKSNTPHFYIGKKDDIYMYDCKRCPSSGILTENTLYKLGIDNQEVIDWIKKYNLNLLSYKHTGKLRSLNKFDYKMPPFNPKDKHKVDYISLRTGIDFSKTHNLTKYKIVLSLKDYIEK